MCLVLDREAAFRFAVHMIYSKLDLNYIILPDETQIEDDELREFATELHEMWAPRED